MRFRHLIVSSLVVVPIVGVWPMGPLDVQTNQEYSQSRIWSNITILFHHHPGSHHPIQHHLQEMKDQCHQGLDHALEIQAISICQEVRELQAVVPFEAIIPQAFLAGEAPILVEHESCQKSISLK